jgi:hypothetical protein
MLSGEQERAPDHLEYALELSSLLGLPETLAHALSSRGVFLMIRNRHYEARALLEAALELALSTISSSQRSARTATLRRR